MTAGGTTAGAVGVPEHKPTGRAPVTRASLRIRTDLRFATLVAAVLASSVVAFSVVQTALPSTERLFQHQVRPCLARIVPATAGIAGTNERLNAQTALANACGRPYFVHEIGWIGAGLLVQAIVTGVLFVLHPWWPKVSWLPAARGGPRWKVRWPRGVRLAGDHNTDLLAELDRLAREAGLSRSPLWLVDPFATTAGGRAFGLPGRPRVCLDVGLVVRYDLAPDEFRAVVRHELAHHHNRDVGRTYLTIATWWSFAVTALVPCAFLSLYPHALQAGHGWSDPGAPGASGKLVYRLAALAVLSVAVYLSRNAILRTRELHADVVAHSWDTTRIALPRIIANQSVPSARTARWPMPSGARRWTDRIGTHPSPERRVAAMADATPLLRTSAWEMAGLGLFTGLALNNLSLLTSNLVGRFVTVGLAVLALPLGLVLAGALAAAVGYGSSADPASARPGQSATALAVAMAAGVAGSRVMSLVSADLAVVAPTIGQYAVIGSLLLTGAVLIALWTRSVCRDRWAVDAGGAKPGRPSRAVTATAAVVGGLLLALWHTCAMNPSAFTTAYVQARPAVGESIGWYADLTRWLADAYFYYPLILFRATPLVPVGLVLLWAVPLLVRGRRRGVTGWPPDTGKALAVGGWAGLVAIAAGIALPYAARAALPADVRQISDFTTVLGTLPFSVVQADLYTAVVALLQAAAAAVTAVLCRRQRPVMVPLTVTVTMALGTLGFYASRGVSRCVALTHTTSHACTARALLPDDYVPLHLHEMAAWGVLAAVPAGLLGAAVSGLFLRHPKPSYTATGAARAKPPRGRRPTALALTLGLLGALVLTAAAAGLPADRRVWVPPVPAAAARSASGAEGSATALGPVTDQRHQRSVRSRRTAPASR